MRKIIVVLLFFNFSFILTKAQKQPLYSQYVFNGLIINPAHMSLESEYSNVTIMNRQQWVGISGAPKTTILSFNTPIDVLKTNIGFLVFQDKVGVNTQTGINLMLSQSITVDENTYFAVGLTAGFNILKEDDLLLNALNDPLFNKNIQTTRGNIGFGITFFTDRFFLGLSTPSFNNIELSKVNYDLTGQSLYYLNTGYLFDITPMIKFKPVALVKKIGNGPISGELMVTFLLNNIIWIGAGWRQSESIIGITQFQLTNNVKIGYSYDYITKNELQTIQKGSHEISLSFRFGSKGRIISPSYF